MLASRGAMNTENTTGRELIVEDAR
jgi:hypothetical protein